MPQGASSDEFAKSIGATSIDDFAKSIGATPVTPPSHPDPSVFESIAQGLKNLGIGALKSTGRTAINIAEVANWIDSLRDGGYISGKLGQGDPVHDANRAQLEGAKTAIGEPEGSAQKIGGLAADVATAFIPGGIIGKASKAAELAVGGSRLLRAGARAAVQGGAGALTSELQGGSPATGGVVSGVIGAVAPGASALARDSSVASEVRALGPAGGRGPTGAANLAKAEELAPDLAKRGLTKIPLTQAQAIAQAQAAVKKTGDELKSVMAASGGATFDQPSLLSSLQAKRAKLSVAGANGPFIPTESAAEDALLAGLEADVKKLGPTPSVDAVHDLKSKWNAVINWNANDPAKGTLSAVYKAGGNLIRAQIRNDHTAISEADQAFHVASTLHGLTTAATVRRPDAGIGAMLSPLARPAIGGALGAGEGYREGGLPGAVAGAVIGTKLGQLMQSPGFSYVSAAMKNKLADALDSGNAARISQVMAAVSAQAAGFAKAKGKQ